MIHSLAQWTIGEYTITRMFDTGAIWYQLEKGNEFVGNYDTYEEAKGAIE